MARAAAYGRPGQYNAPLGTDTFIFKDDGSVPNSRLPLIVRQGAITPDATDPASAFERTFAKNGWTKSWRDGIFDYHHYHSTAHEALGVPAGVGHARISQSDDLLVVGAYAEGRDWDIIRATDAGAIGAARQRIAQVPLPEADPVDGASGPLMKLWGG